MHHPTSTDPAPYASFSEHKAALELQQALKPWWRKFGSYVALIPLVGAVCFVHGYFMVRGALMQAFGYTGSVFAVFAWDELTGIGSSFLFLKSAPNILLMILIAVALTQLGWVRDHARILVALLIMALFVGYVLLWVTPTVTALSVALEDRADVITILDLFLLGSIVSVALLIVLSEEASSKDHNKTRAIRFVVGGIVLVSFLLEFAASGIGVGLRRTDAPFFNEALIHETGAGNIGSEEEQGSERPERVRFVNVRSGFYILGVGPDADSLEFRAASSVARLVIVPDPRVPSLRLFN